MARRSSRADRFAAQTLALEPLGSLRSFEPSGRSVALEFDGAAGEFFVTHDGSVCVRIAPAGALPPDAEHALGRAPWPPAPLDAKPSESGGFVEDTQPGRSSLSRGSGLGLEEVVADRWKT